jgi:hypothetical protein
MPRTPETATPRARRPHSTAPRGTPTEVQPRCGSTAVTLVTAAAVEAARCNRSRGLAGLRRLLRHPRTGLEPADAAAVPAPVRDRAPRLAAVTAATPAEQRVVLGPGVHLHSWLALGLPALQPLLVALLLVATRDRFPVRARPGTYRRWGRWIGLAAVLLSAVYVLGSVLFADQYVPPPDVPDLLADLPTRLLPPGYLGELDPAFLPQGFLATLLFEWTDTVFWSVVLVAGLATFARTPPPGAGSDLARIRARLAVTSGSSLAHMATGPGHSYLSTTDRGGADVAAVAFRGDQRSGADHGRPGGRSAPARPAVLVLAGHPFDQRGYHRVDRWATEAIRVVPLLGHQAAVPPQGRCRSDQAVTAQHHRQASDQGGEQGSVGPVQAGLRVVLRSTATSWRRGRGARCPWPTMRGGAVSASSVAG